MLYTLQILLGDLSYTRMATQHEACLCVLLLALSIDVYACVLPCSNHVLTTVVLRQVIPSLVGCLAHFSYRWRPMQKAYGIHSDTDGAAQHNKYYAAQHHERHYECLMLASSTHVKECCCTGHQAEHLSTLGHSSSAPVDPPCDPPMTQAQRPQTLCGSLNQLIQ